MRLACLFDPPPFHIAHPSAWSRTLWLHSKLNSQAFMPHAHPHLYGRQQCDNLMHPMQARHTGIKIVQQIAILMGCAVLPHLKSMVDIIKHGLKDENQKVKTITALSLAGGWGVSAAAGKGGLGQRLRGPGR